MIPKPLPLAIAVILLLISCQRKEALTFEEQRLGTSILPVCKETTCANISIKMIHAIGKSSTASMINNFMEHKICNVLSVGLQEQQPTIENAIKTFNDFYLEQKGIYATESAPYEAELTQEITFNSTNLISTAIDYYTYTGGAHGYGGVLFINFNPQTGEHLTHTTLLKDKKAFSAYAEQIFRSKFNIPETASINSTGFFFEEDRFALPENIGITKEEVVLYYNTYEISSYADGPVALKLPKKEVSAFFKYDIL
ncbi:uncharacterized protein DUF3298 [Aquimarina brevivitae]|uniref:Uncharacterized protein DUF3298 n=2 Tax=Aquimarina brevivitae TaxID=323412 RepID=A0A4Q7PF94_9FLAO|nr:uncharacterized protein DUF3298 [Aquimarina brevivitae]